jgi:hypothetical protein
MKPQQIDSQEWLYMGCFISKQEHPQLSGNYSVFQNNEEQTDIGRCYTFAEAKKLCEQNICTDNAQLF